MKLKTNLIVLIYIGVACFLPRIGIYLNDKRMKKMDVMDLKDNFFQAISKEWMLV